MGIMMNKNEDENNMLSRRINADLRSRAMESSAEAEDPDFAEDAEYLKDLKKTGKFGWVWAVLIVLALISLIIILI